MMLMKQGGKRHRIGVSSDVSSPRKSNISVFESCSTSRSNSNSSCTGSRCSDSLSCSRYGFDSVGRIIERMVYLENKIEKEKMLTREALKTVSHLEAALAKQIKAQKFSNPKVSSWNFP
mmetsp:Transcript_19467/g.23675  ORF Transcript_19467/g.23675 Transcript_19467/m.23675 type:complete len:119 (-) Transcript_19467:382-738(-)